MPRYHFHVSLNGELRVDREGVDLPDEMEVQKQAFLLAPELMKDNWKDNWPEMPDGGQIAVIVRDGQPRPLMTLHLSLWVERRS
jgi:hypothetical protein